MGASTPHFALQLRNRIAKLIAGLPAGHPARVEGEREIARLERLGLTGEDRGEGAAEGERPLPSLSLRRSEADGRRRSAPARAEDALAAGVLEARAQEPVEEPEERHVDDQRRDARAPRRARRARTARARPRRARAPSGTAASRAVCER